MTKILAIDTSCDETSVAILENRKVLSNVVSSQTEIHKKWGGVVPALAKRTHIENLPGAYQEALKRARLEISEIDVIAATQGPGLAIDLEVGLKFAQQLAIEHSKPFVPVNHMEGHLLSSLLLNSKGKSPYNSQFNNSNLEELFPALGMLISGKHTEILYVDKIGSYTKIGKTLDDAAGEAFDKVGRMLGFGYPGGPILSEFAESGKPNDAISLPIPMEHSKDYNFSYSGLKTACLLTIKELRDNHTKDTEWVYDFCFEFLETIKKTIFVKLGKALNDHPEIKSVFAGGGVYGSERLSRKLGNFIRSYDIHFLLPEKKYRGDNAAMIGLAGYFAYERGEYLTAQSDIEAIDRVPRLSL